MNRSAARAPSTRRAIVRLLRALAHALHGALICAAIFPFLDEPARMRRVQWWSARMLVFMGIELRVTGALEAAPVLLLANHVSWLDILVLNSLRPVRFVSKADIRRWPLLGFMVARSGTLFIERERKRDALRVVQRIAAALADGATVAVFPEGTTSDGPRVLPFHANLLQAAIAAAVPVQAVALRFSDATARFSAAAAYVGSTTLIESAWRVASADALSAEVTVLSSHPVAAHDRRGLARVVRQQIQDVLDRQA